jgi:hypothetical protein
LVHLPGSAPRSRSLATSLCVCVCARGWVHTMRITMGRNQGVRGESRMRYEYSRCQDAK